MDEEVSRLVRTLTKHEDVEMRSRAALELTKLGDIRAFEPLMGSLTDQAPTSVAPAPIPLVLSPTTGPC